MARLEKDYREDEKDGGKYMENEGVDALTLELRALFINVICF